MSSKYIRIPPDSTGKRIRHTYRLDIELINSSFNFNTLSKGDTIIGDSSMVESKFMGFQVYFNSIFIFVDEVNGDYQVGETLSNNNVTLGEVSSILTLYVPSINITDPDNPYVSQKFDRKGSSNVRFSDGDALLDAFGNLQFSQAYRLDDFSFVYGDVSSEKFYDKSLSGGTYSASTIDSSLILYTNTTNGSLISRTTNQYYPYTPGHSNMLLVSLMVGDLGKANVVRRWGLFDDYNGVFFQLSGTTFQVVIRNNSTGTIVDNVVPQNSFNGDQLDDANLSEYQLFLNKLNLYWIDFQWLGVGKVRFGTFSPSGNRVVMHTFGNPNSYTVPYMNLGSLPFKVEQFNTDVAESNSELKIVCASIMRHSVDSVFSGKENVIITELKSISGTTKVPLVSAIPKLLYNGKTNRVTIVPTEFQVDVSGDSVRIDFIFNGALSGATFNHNINSISCGDFDTDATSISGGTIFNSILFGSGTNRITLGDQLENTLKLGADGVTQPQYTISVSTNKPSGSSDVVLLLRWKEVK